MGADTRPGFRNLELLPAPNAGSRQAYLEKILTELGTPDPDQAAKALLREYHTFKALAHAPSERLAALLPARPELANALTAAFAIVTAGQRERAVGTVLDCSNRALLDYLSLSLGHRREEVLVGFFASPDGMLLREATLAIGDGHSVTISPSAVMRSAIEIGASKILLVHNHPSGAARPSKADQVALQTLDRHAAALDYSIIDHLIVAQSRIFSMRKRRAL